MLKEPIEEQTQELIRIRIAVNNIVMLLWFILTVLFFIGGIIAAR